MRWRTVMVRRHRQFSASKKGAEDAVQYAGASGGILFLFGCAVADRVWETKLKEGPVIARWRRGPAKSSSGPENGLCLLEEAEETCLPKSLFGTYQALGLLQSW